MLDFLKQLQEPGHRPEKVARALVETSSDRGIPLERTQLQVLLFVAHGIHLAEHDRPLVRGQFAAANWGPEITKFSQAMVEEELHTGTDWRELKGRSSQKWGALPDADKEAWSAVTQAVDLVGHLEPMALFDWARRAEGHWNIAHVVGQAQPDIDNSAIKAFFEKELPQLRQASPARKALRP